MTLSHILTLCGLPTLDGTDDTAQFLVDEKLKLVFHLPAGEKYLQLRAVVAQLPGELLGSKAMEIAAANYNGAITGGAALGLNPENGEVLLSLILPCEAMTASMLEETVSRFVDTALFWINRFLTAGKDPVERPSNHNPSNSWIAG